MAMTPKERTPEEFLAEIESELKNSSKVLLNNAEIHKDLIQEGNRIFEAMQKEFEARRGKGLEHLPKGPLLSNIAQRIRVLKTALDRKGVPEIVASGAQVAATPVAKAVQPKGPQDTSAYTHVPVVKGRDVQARVKAFEPEPVYQVQKVTQAKQHEYQAVEHTAKFEKPKLAAHRKAATPRKFVAPGQPKPEVQQQQVQEPKPALVVTKQQPKVENRNMKGERDSVVANIQALKHANKVYLEKVKVDAEKGRGHRAKTFFGMKVKDTPEVAAAKQRDRDLEQLYNFATGATLVLAPLASVRNGLDGLIAKSLHEVKDKNFEKVLADVQGNVKALKVEKRHFEMTEMESESSKVAGDEKTHEELLKGTTTFPKRK